MVTTTDISNIEGPGEGRQLVGSDPTVIMAVGSQSNRAAVKYPKTKKVGLVKCSNWREEKEVLCSTGAQVKQFFNIHDLI